ncbi:hypothetical protein BH20VER1_BH20VER1_17820 [soil metagenome]
MSSDEFEGPRPGSKGEELTVKYITEQFKAVGLKPGNPDGTYVQEVPLAGLTVQPTATFRAGEERSRRSFRMNTSPPPPGCEQPGPARPEYF